MGIERSFSPERLVVGTLRASSFSTAVMEGELESLFGPIDYRGPEFPFVFSDYYEAEMGTGLLRSFYSFARLIDPAGLADCKLATDALERGWAGEGGRPVNLDPGLLSLGRFILATTKNRSQRVPLRDGIYAELTLYYRDGDFRPLPWTYPDWQSPAYLAVLRDLRSRLKSDLKRELPPRA
jgi:hypothetical protein